MQNFAAAFDCWENEVIVSRVFNESVVEDEATPHRSSLSFLAPLAAKCAVYPGPKQLQSPVVFADAYKSSHENLLERQSCIQKCEQSSTR